MNPKELSGPQDTQLVDADYIPDTTENIGDTAGLDAATAEVGGDAMSASKLADGTVINGRYTVQRSIGHGGMGWVYEVTDNLHPGQSLALKTMLGMGNNPAKLTLFRSEFLVMTKLEHPNVARVYDFGEIQGSSDFLITMELVQGGPLNHAMHLLHGWEIVVERLVQVCRALSYMHSRRIVHFDLKPANILVTTSGVVKVVDFGIAGAEPLKQDGGYVGTLHYMAPELVLGMGSADHRADLYALGVTAYELLLGHLPCTKRHLDEFMDWLREGDVRIPADELIPPWLSRVVERLMAKNPADRFRTANAVIEAINQGGGFAYEAETAQTRHSYITTPRFSGRADELQAVSRFIEQRLSGTGGESVLMVSGLAGIGKSRLMREVRYQAQLQRQVFLESNCYERSSAEYGPIADLLYQLVPLVESRGGVEAVTVALPELVKLGPRLAEGRQYQERPKAATSEGEQALLYEACAEFFVQAATHIPYIVYINDLHWAARGTAQIFTHIARRVRDDQAMGGVVRLGLIGAYRSDEVEGRALAQMVHALGTHRLAKEVKLASLGTEDVAQVVHSMLGVQEVPAEFLVRVTQETQGNPFFVQEVMRVLFENGSVYLREGQWAAKGKIEELQIPATMADVFRRRFSLLAGAEQELVRIIAVHGRPMDLELLDKLAGGAGTVMETLGELSEKGIVLRQEGKLPVFNMAHDRMRETIYGDLSETERQGLHQLLAEKLEAVSAGMEELQKPLDELARHYREAKVEDKAIDYARRAGRRAFTNYANAAAVEHLSYVARTDEARGTPDIEIVELYAQALTRVGDTTSANRVLSEGLKWAHSPQSRARIHTALSKNHRAASDLPACIEEGWLALEALGVDRPRSQYAALWKLLGSVGWLLRQKTVSCPDDAGSSLAREQVYAYSWLTSAYAYLGTNPILLMHIVIAAARAADQSGRSEARGFGRTVLGGILAVLDKHESAAKWLTAALQDGEAHKSFEVLTWGLYFRWVMERGHFKPSAESEPQLLRCLQCAQATGSSGIPSVLSGSLFELARLGRWPAALALYDKTMDYMRRSMPNLLQDEAASIHSPLVILHATADAEQAVSVMRKALSAARATKQSALVLVVGGSGAEALVACGHAAEARSMLEECMALSNAQKTFLVTREVFRLLPRLYLQDNPGDPAAQAKAVKVVKLGWKLVSQGHEDKRPLVEMSQALVFEAQGKQIDASAMFARAVQTARDHAPGLFYLSDVLLQRGLMLQKRGDHAAAQRDMKESQQLASQCGDKYMTKLCDQALSSY
jgi:tetratricopeptide (TPR) repeat protein